MIGSISERSLQPQKGGQVGKRGKSAMSGCTGWALNNSRGATVPSGGCGT